MEINEMSKRSKIVVVVDENMLSVKAGLKDLGLKVVSFPSGTRDENMFSLLTNRVIVTKNTKDFRIDAILHDFDIVNCDHIKYIDNDQTRKNETAILIDKAIRESKLSSIRYNVIITINANGTWTMEENI